MEGRGPPPTSGPVGPPLTRQGRKGGSTRRARRSSQLMCRKKGCLCGYSAPKHATSSPPPWLPQELSALTAPTPRGDPRPTCTSAASPGPPPIRWLGFRFRNCRTRAEGEGLGEGYCLVYPPCSQGLAGVQDTGRRREASGVWFPTPQVSQGSVQWPVFHEAFTKARGCRITPGRCSGCQSACVPTTHAL